MTPLEVTARCLLKLAAEFWPLILGIIFFAWRGKNTQ